MDNEVVVNKTDVKKGQVVEVQRTGSAFLSFNVGDFTGVIKQALLVGAAAALTFVMQNLSQIEVGQNTLIILPLITAGLNALISWLKDNTTAKVVVKEDEDKEDKDEGGQ